MKFINIGFGNMIAASKVVAVVSPDSAPIKRLITETRDGGMLVDASFGRRTKSVIIMESGHVILSGLQPETVGSRLDKDADFSFDSGKETV